MSKRTKLLEKAIYEVLNRDYILDADVDVASKYEAVVWTYEEHNGERSIRCHYLDWNQEHQVWIEDTISEMEGPAALTCPIRFFNYEVAEDERFDEWRYEVKKYHEQVGSSAQEGEVAKRLVDAIMKKWRNKNG